MEEKETVHGIMRVVKTQVNDHDEYMVVVGRTIVSRGTFMTREEAIKDVEKVDTELICKIVIATTDAMQEYEKQMTKLQKQ